MFRRSTQNVLCALGFVGGIALRSWVALPLVMGYALGCMGVVVAVVWWKEMRWRVAGVIAVFLFLGIWRTDAALQPPPHSDISYWAGRTVVVEGTVARDPDVRLKTEKVVVEVKNVGARLIAPVQVSGNLLITLPAVYAIEVGDVLQMQCEVKKPEPIEDFDYPRYLAKDSIYALCAYPDIISHTEGARGLRWVLARLKHDFIASLFRVVNEPESTFLTALLTGARGRIPDGVIDDFVRTGVSHLIAISGYNITIIATGILGLLTLFIRRHAAFPFLVVIISGFTVLVGGSASVVRAAIMGLMLHAAYVSDRMYKPFHGLILVAAFMLAQNPRLLRDDLGFDLSFLATIGILAVSPLVQRRLSFIPERWKLRETIAMTLSAQVTTLPLLVGSFDRVSAIAPLANLLLVPWVPFLMALGFIAGILGIFPLVGMAAGAAAWVMARLFLLLTHALARVPGAAWSVPSWSWTIVVVLYALAIILWWQRRFVEQMWNEYRQRFRSFYGVPPLIRPKEVITAQSMEVAVVPIDESLFCEPVITLEEKKQQEELHRDASIRKKIINWVGAHRYVVVASVLFVLFLAFSLPPYLHSRRFGVTFLDVGQGDAALIQIPGGQQVLIDGGPDAGILGKLGSTLSWWDRTIEYVVLTHPHADHMTGLVDVLKRYRVGKVVMTGVVHTTDEYLAFLDEVRRKNIPTQFVAAGDSFELGAGVIDVLAPFERLEGKRVEELNGTSIVLRFVYGDASFLFMGDAPVAVEEQLLANGEWNLESDVLKVGHHGSSDSNSEDFITAVAPHYAIISVGKGNPYGHPSLRTIKRLERAGATILLTDLFGDIRFSYKKGTLQLTE
ncbi:MAG: ComEC/Rec2 family competence protein [Patescibacteria group bacterium]